MALLLVQTANQAVILSTPAGFVPVASSPQGTGTAGGTAATRLTVFWARATSTAMTTPVIADSGNNQVAQIITFRSVIGTGDPWDVTAGDVAATASASFTIPGATTTVTNALVVAMVANATDTTTAQTSGWTNANLTGLTERADFNGSSGNGGGFGVATGVKATAGAYGNTTGNLATLSVQGRLSLALKPKTTTLGDGTNPASVTIGPGAAITDLDSFTLQTSNGTDSITALTVTLTGTNPLVGLSEVRITSSDGATTYFNAVTNPGSNTVSFSGGTPIPVTSTATTFKVRITPKSHANMPIPPGATYTVGGTVTAFTSTNEQLGADGASATVTIDNASPAGATAVSGSAGIAQTTLNWTTSNSLDFATTSGSVMYRWAAATAGTEVPAEGSTPTLGSINGTATVACLVSSVASTVLVRIDGTGGSADCTTTALTAGQPYTYRIFQKDANGNYDTGATLGTFTPVAGVGGFNAYETATAPGAVAGVIKTKIAGSAFNLDLVALNSAKTAIATAFTGAVKVEFLDSSAGGVPDANGCNATWPTIQTLATNPVFLITDNGRKTVSFQENNAWRNVRVRISFPAIGVATAIGCSTDNFAIRPDAFANLGVSDSDWQTAGTTRTLNETVFTAGVRVHKAGRPFTVRADALNAAGVPVATTNYSGTPTTILSACLDSACTATFGSFALGAPFAAGSLDTSTATYSDVGAFRLQLVDSTFAAVDAADGSSAAERNIVSSVIDVGRFVPDHFTVSLNTPTLGPACSGSPTYVGQAFNYVTPPVITVTARNFQANPTTLYAGAWARITNGTVSPGTQADRYSRFDVLGGGMTPSLDLTGLPAPAGDPVVSPFDAGTGTLSFTSDTGFRFTRTTPVAPFQADIALALHVIDADGVAFGGNPVTFGTATSGGGILFSGGNNRMRYGRLRLQNAYGSELLPLRVPVRAEYFNGTGWLLNTADSCTTIPAAALAKGNVQPPASLPVPTATLPVTLSSGQSNIILTQGATKYVGSVDLALNLRSGAGNDQSCVTWGVTPVTTGADLPWLQFPWCGGKLDPAARIRFGSPKAPYIYLRERY